MYKKRGEVKKMNPLEEFIKLVPGDRYTIVWMGEFGFPCSRQITLTSVRKDRYAQYTEAYYVTFVPRGKRKNRQVVFYGKKAVIVWPGWVSPDVTMYRNTEIKDTDTGSVAVSKSFPCFDERYMTIALESVKVIVPVIVILDGLYKPDDTKPVATLTE